MRRRRQRREDELLLRTLLPPPLEAARVAIAPLVGGPEVVVLRKRIMALNKFGTFRTLADIRIPCTPGFPAAEQHVDLFVVTEKMTLCTRLRRVGLRSRTSCCISLLSTPRGAQLMGRPSTTKSREGRVNASFFPTRTNLCFEKRRRDEADDDTVLVVNFNPAAGHPLPRSARSGAVREIELSDMAAVTRPDDDGRFTSPGRAARARTPPQSGS